MALPATWRSDPYAPGTFRVVRDLTATTNWQDLEIRSMAQQGDVLAQAEAEGLTFTDVAQRAVLRRVEFQNLGSVEVYITERAIAGGALVTSPSNAFVTAQSDGGGAELEWTVRMQGLKCQYRCTAGTAKLNASIWFDVPEAP